MANESKITKRRLKTNWKNRNDAAVKLFAYIIMDRMTISTTNRYMCGLSLNGMTTTHWEMWSDAPKTKTRVKCEGNAAAFVACTYL